MTALLVFLATTALAGWIAAAAWRRTACAGAAAVRRLRADLGEAVLVADGLRDRLAEAERAVEAAAAVAELRALAASVPRETTAGRGE